ncbi:MAG TPA: hypothetical protein VMR73_00370 [Candidatus Paceibacterota bacterium]|nr:hypothetical protein [Candidatus Paceibacterota bacterium]
MIDPELKNHLETIENEIVKMRKGSTGIPYTLWRGIVYGAGYVIGAVFVILIVGWILNIIGVIPYFNNQVIEFRTALQNVGGTLR